MSGPVICIGASLVDELFYLQHEWLPATTNHALPCRAAGGVSRNIAHQLALLDVEVCLVSVFGNDTDGEWLKQQTRAAGVSLDACITRQGNTGKYTGIIHPDGSLHSAFLTNNAHHLITPGYLSTQKYLLEQASLILADANLAVETVEWLVTFSRQMDIPLVLETVSVPPAAKFRQAELNGLFLITPNEDELPVLCSGMANQNALRVKEMLQRGVQCIWLHQGKQGSTFFSKEKNISLPAPHVQVVDCTGAGDGSVAGFIFGKILGFDDLSCLKLAHTLSAEILQVQGAIAHHLSRAQLLEMMHQYYPE